MQFVMLAFGILFTFVGLVLSIVFFYAGEPLVACFPLLFVIIGGVCLYLYIKKKLLARRLKANGRKLWAVITDVSPNYSVTINGRHPYILHCEYNGLMFQADYSKPVTRNLVGQTVIVYVDENDPAKYFVDISEL